MKPMSSSPTVLKPAPLQPGDSVGIIAPASPIQREALEAGCQAIRNLGFRTFYFDNIFNQDLYFAGPPDQRARDLEEMFERDDIRAVICARGGYGANYLLPYLDIELLRRYPKIFVGYSDVTALHTRMNDAGLVTFHGPMVTKDFAVPEGVHLPTFHAAVSGRAHWGLDSQAIPEFRPVLRGDAEGLLYGGCLSILAASLGTPFEIHTKGKIFFLEDVTTKPYQIDRMLMQLKYAGKLDGVAGLIFGEMLGCAQPGGQDYALEDVVRRIVRELRIPVAFGMPSGHVTHQNVTLPLGVRVRLTVEPDCAQLQFLESATALRPAAPVTSQQPV